MALQMGSKADVIDNCGALIVNVFKVLGGSKKFIAKVGDIVKVSVRKAKPNGKVKEGSVYSAVVVTVRQSVVRKTGVVVKFPQNSVVIIDSKGEPLGTRIVGTVDRSIKVMHPRIFALAPEAA